MDIDNQYGTLEIQERLLVLLKVFHSFCVENDIKYSTITFSLAVSYMILKKIDK